VICPPVIGAVRDGNDESKIKWLAKAAPQDGERGQFEYMSFFSTDCDGERDGDKRV